MEICFLARPCYDKFSAAIFNTIKEKFDHNSIGHFITMNEEESKFILETVPGGIVHEASAFLKEHWDSYTQKDLVAVEQEYDCAPIWNYIYTDRFLIHRDYDYCIKVTVGLFRFFEEIFKNNSIDYYYSETIATLLCYVAYLVGKKYGVQYISQMTARGLDATHHYFLMDAFQGNVNFHEDYMEREYSEEEYQRADAFLKDFESRDIPPENMVFAGEKPTFKLKFLALPALRFIRSFKKEFRDPCSYMYYKAYKEITDPLVFYIKYQRAKKYYHSANYDEKFVYYPLHYQPEASTIVCAQKYEKQLFFIDSWAKSIPADTKLYVKEHYAILGHRDLSFYEELKKYPNVVLIDPWESSRKLMEKAQAVTTLTGTAGWEAMLLRRPVFIGGNIFFDNAPGVIKVDDIYLNYLPLIDSWKKPERERTVKYLCEYFRTLYEGNVYAANPASLDPVNIERIAKALVEQMVLHKQKVKA